MNGLQKLMQMKRMQDAAKSPTPHVTGEGLTRDNDTITSDMDETGGDNPVDSTVDSPAPASAPPVKPGGFRLNLAGASKPAGESVQAGAPAADPAPAKPSNPLARLAAMRVTPDKGIPTPAPVESGDFTLEDLASAEVADEALVIRGRSSFDDEIEATAPVREYDGELTTQQSQFIESLDGIYTVLNDAEMFGQMVRNIMMELQEHPEYAKLVADQDIHTMIRAMRNTMGLAKIKKTESKAKRGGGGGRKSKTSEADADMLATLEGLAGFDGDE